MRSIRTKIITTFLTLVFVTFIFIVSSVVVNINLLDRYNQINENIVYEQQLKDEVWLLVEDSYNALKSGDFTQYNKRLDNIKSIEKILDVNFDKPDINKESRLAYRSVKNSLNSVIDLTEKNIQRQKGNQQNILGISEIFSEAAVKFEFVKETINDLLFVEIKNIAETSKNIQNTQLIFVPLVIVIVLVGSIILIIFSIVFSRKITDPLISLSSIAKSISDGNTDILISKGLLEREDEIGSLSNSFDKMLKRLLREVSALEFSSKELQQNNSILNDSKKAIVNLLEDVAAEKAGIEKTVQERTKELSEEKSRLFASINSLSIGYIMIGIDGSILLNNNAVLDILGIKENPKQISEISKNFSGFDLENSCKDCLISNKIINIDDIEFKNKFLKIFCSPIMNDQKTIGQVLLIEDITEEKIMERSKDDFFAVASHELRTPLTAIRGNTELIMSVYADKVTDPEVREMISDIESASVRLIGIVNDFLEISRIEQGSIVFDKKAFNINDLIEKVIGSMKLVVAGKDLELSMPNVKDLPKVFADPVRLEQVLFNLIGNSVKFTEKGSITVSTEVLDNKVRVSIKDTGLGMSEQSQGLLFRKFQPAGEKSLVRDVSKSTGLGLYISKMLIERMGGEIGLVKSELNVGSEFFFTIPISS